MKKILKVIGGILGIIVVLEIVFFILNAIFLYLIVLGANKCKTPEERKMEDDEESKCLSKLKKK